MIKNIQNILWVTVLFSSIFLTSCKQDYQPKPYGYYRIDLPEHAYVSLGNEFAYSFEIPTYTTVIRRKEKNWINLYFPDFDAQIHFTYKRIQNDLNVYLEESRSLAFNHTQKAEGIQEIVYHNNETNIHGLLYDIEGRSASSIQFYITDSIDHFLRGALYFNAVPNPDSISAVNEFIKTDIIHLIETAYWTADDDQVDTQ